MRFCRFLKRALLVTSLFAFGAIFIPSDVSAQISLQERRLVLREQLRKVENFRSASRTVWPNLLETAPRAARDHGAQLAAQNCTSRSFDEFLRKLMIAQRELHKQYEAFAKAVRDQGEIVLTPPIDQEFLAEYKRNARFVSEFSNFLSRASANNFKARLLFADSALTAGCVNVADAQYRNVLKFGGTQFSARAMVGIQDVREKRALNIPRR